MCNMKIYETHIWGLSHVGLKTFSNQPQIDPQLRIQPVGKTIS